ncbi:MAG: DUF58 domain-containing protein [Haloarculaceae archaeon]
MTTVRTTRRWRGVVAVALVAGGAGVLLERPSLLLLSAASVAFAAYPRLTGAPEPTLELDRRVAADQPAPGEAVTVTVTVRNAGDDWLSDVRIVDGVPPMLAVADGTPRHAAVLGPGQSTTFSYSVRADRGTHRFEPATALVRDLAGATEVETELSVETAIACADAVPEVPLRTQPGQRVGDLVTDEGGAGIEFHRTREYRRGDSRNRVDWKRFARTGELTTVEYRQERDTSVLLVLDAREAAYRARSPAEPHAVSRGRAAVEQLFAALGETPHRVGIAALGPELGWLVPGSGAEHAARARALLGSHPTLSARPPDEATGTETLDGQVSALRSRLGPDAQVVVVSPLPDGDLAAACLRFEAAGHAVTVLSPDVTTGDTVGGRLAGVEREARIERLRASDVPVIDWPPDEPLGSVLLAAEERRRA